MTRETTNLPATPLPVGPVWDGVRGNYDLSRDPIDRVILHTICGKIEWATPKFCNPDAASSAHYGVSLSGSVYQWVKENATAYHATNIEVNRRSIGIEHEDLYDPATNPQGFNDPRPDSLYAASAKLVNDICTFYSIPIDEEHILPHRAVSLKPTACPAALDVARIIREARAIGVGGAAVTPPPAHDGASNSPGQPPVCLEPATFVRIVTKSANLDDLCTGLGGNYPEETRTDPTFGKKLAASLVADARIKDTQIEELTRKLAAATSPPPAPEPPPPPVQPQKQSIFTMDLRELWDRWFGKGGA